MNREVHVRILREPGGEIPPGDPTGREPPEGLRARQLRFPRLHLPGPSCPGPRGYFTGFNPAISGKAKKAKGQQIRGWHLNRRSSADLSGLAEEINPQVQGLDQLLRSLLPLRVALPRMAHQRAPRPVGHAEVQAIPRQVRQSDGLAAKGLSVQARPVRPLAAHRVHRKAGLWGPDDGRLSRPVLRAAGGEIPPADSARQSLLDIGRYYEAQIVVFWGTLTRRSGVPGANLQLEASITPILINAIWRLRTSDYNYKRSMKSSPGASASAVRTYPHWPSTAVTLPLW